MRLKIPTAWLHHHYTVGWNEAAWKGGGACNINIVRTVTLQRQSTRASRLWHTSPTCYFYPWLLIVVSSEPHRRPLWRILSSLTSACPSLLLNQRFSQMSSWDKWEPFADVMAPRNDMKCFSFCPFTLHFFILSYRIYKSLLLFCIPNVNFLYLFLGLYNLMNPFWHWFRESSSTSVGILSALSCITAFYFEIQPVSTKSRPLHININAQNILNTKMTKNTVCIDKCKWLSYVKTKSFS